MESTDNTNQEDLQTLTSEGIHIWSTTQEVLEDQALKELEILVEEKNKALTTPIENEIVIQYVPSTSSTAIEEDSEDNSVVENSESDYIPSEEEVKKPERKKQKVKKKVSLRNITDDAVEANYKDRLNNYYKWLEQELQTLEQDIDKKDFKKLKGGLKVPLAAWERLYEYQKEGVYWLWELHQRTNGGLLGDEMGLGKTVQIIVFLLGLQYSGVISKFGHYRGVGASIIVCPATVVQQWVKHFHEWAPEFRVAVLHQSGSHQGPKAKLIKSINENRGILVTTYAGILKYKGNICEHHWHYLVLDEGHKIRNPSAKATIAVKEIRTPHRIMLTGSPMQNNLTELWSLFDFTNPGMLGNLPTFTEHFSQPILQGGFANASPMQEATALSVASTLKNVISPFLLRRMKNEVKEDIQLPNKSEQVLFCSLTEQQRLLYKDYLISEQVNNILGKGIKSFRSDNFIKANILMAVTSLRKICNHPDLFRDEDSVEDSSYNYYKKSGKMIVVSALLKIWKKQGHRALLFSQGRLMMRIFEQFLNSHGYKYLKMDGTTSVRSRQGLIEKFNQDSSFDLFLLTTRVGGLGVNLIGANRVIIYDPDWNPATDSQARERAWRIGQRKSVIVYRLLCAGTVEEKIYQRQVWKQLLSNKVLIDPATNKFFKSSDLFDLFSLPDSPEAHPETTNIFRDSRVKLQEKIKEKSKSSEVEFSEDKIKAMKELAQRISKSIAAAQPQKDPYREELEEERMAKLKERQKLKTLSPQQIIKYNKLKVANCEDDSSNKLDGQETRASFAEALDRGSNTAILYRKMISKEIKQKDIKILKRKLHSVPETNNKSAKLAKTSHHVDTSGLVDGEEVEGLVKREVRKPSSLKSGNTQDNYILEHLFSKKGVSGALEHESVLNSGNKPHSLRDRSYADEKAMKALEALKKSRLKAWKW
ncbi:DNA excision repair protein ERCC-6-like [Euwallacea fornicatus]|uniref:DNA excision repair protein ERCC-6-like n=1 Tax=Euwallacea fornicatus TaxID=995702 RepID=UPI00338F934E